MVLSAAPAVTTDTTTATIAVLKSETMSFRRSEGHGWFHLATKLRAVGSDVYTFLSTDIEGSTRLWEDHPDAIADALAIRDQITR